MIYYIWLFINVIKSSNNFLKTFIYVNIYWNYGEECLVSQQTFKFVCKETNKHSSSWVS